MSMLFEHNEHLCYADLPETPTHLELLLHLRFLVRPFSIQLDDRIERVELGRCSQCWPSCHTLHGALGVHKRLV